ncbi:RAD23 homolog A, nucleotide excision repair protein a [Clarias gariepinus]|uniref:RAD23 homolog A, nucleotide excision repair protein a n=1 Tax=Clarias gariepinus TaxID=13013 RepID=UPI00234C808F|nr:RAD23 homolog A, nucleotide excision repair protein a [Clarias gariepinus]
MGSTYQKAEPPHPSSAPLSPSYSSSSSSSRHYPPPPCPSPAALPYNPGNCSPDPPHSEQQSGSGDNSDNLFQASGWPLPDNSRTPVQETTTNTPPETHDGEPERHNDDEKLNEPVQESQDREEVETNVGGQDEMGCTGGKGEPDNTSK